MEESENKPVVPLRSRKNEAKYLLKKCFGNNIFSFVPFEIWRDIVCEGERDVVACISQTCWGFKELVDNLRELLLDYALKYRREDKIPQAKKHIMRCAGIGNSRAMFHIGYAYSNKGWGVFLKDYEKGAAWFKKSAQLKNGAGMAYYAYFLLHGIGGYDNEELSNVWAKKALSSKDPFAIGHCFYKRLGTNRNIDKVNKDKTFEHFKVSAEEGDEYGQRWFADLLFTRDFFKAFFWYLKSAEQGHAECQYTVGYMLKTGKGCEKNEELSRMWYKKASNQGYDC